MARISEEEKANATLLPLHTVLSGDDDTERAFEEFRDSFQTGDEPGVVRAWKLQIDERGNIGTTKAQIRLGSWPIDAYRFDELCQMIVDQYMEPGQDMAVRLVGTKKDQTGYIFNKIVMLKRAIKKESSSNGGETTGSLMKLLQENNERMIAMFQKMQAPAGEKPDTMGELQKMMVFAQAMNAPMQQLLSTLLPALAGRPVPAASDPFANMTGLLDVAERLSEMRGGGGGGTEGGDDNSLAGILRAIVPLAKPALEALPAIAAMQAARPQAARLLPVASARPPAPGSVPTAAPSAQPIPAPAPAPTAPIPTIQPTDIPSQDAQMLAQLKPQIDSLVQMAEAGSDASGAADFVFEQVMLDPRLSEDDFEKLAGFVDSNTFVNYVIVMNPAARAHAQWFEAFKAQIIKRLQEETETIDTPSSAVPIVKSN